MPCNICGRGACASWMHSAEEQKSWDSISDMSERELKKEILSLRDEVQRLQEELKEAIESRDSKIEDQYHTIRELKSELSDIRDDGK